jgi:hypothetical protein
MVLLFKTLSKKLFAKRKKISDTEQPDIHNISLNNPDARTLKPIVEVVLQTDEFIVTIDNSLSVNWMTNGGYKGYAKDFSAVTSKVQLLSAQIDQLFANKANRHKYKRIIAEALALALDEKESGNALAILKEVESVIKDYGKERVRIAYIFYASLTTCLIGILIATFVHYKNSSWLFAGNANIYEICIATLTGGIGAFVSTFIRFRNYEGNIISGLSAHRLDGFLRILYGCIAALILGLAIYSNTIFGFLNTSASQWVIYFLAAVAGASEFLIPNVIRSVKAKRGNESTSIFKEKDVTEEPDKSSATEKRIVNSINNNDDAETLHQQNKETDKMQEEADIDKNGSIEEIVMIEENKENEQPDETLYQLNKELDEVLEQDGDINNTSEEMTVIYDKKKDQEDHKTLRYENENQKSNNKLQEEFKITEQLVQGKMDLQDY